LSEHRLTYVDLHTCGEPVRIVTGGYPELTGATILAKRNEAREQHDRYRRALMLEPRGHAGMYGVIPVKATHPEAAFGVLFIHNEGYSTMCGHATIALGRHAIERGLVPAIEPVTRFAIEAPCGLVRLACAVKDGLVGEVSFESVPAFVHERDLAIAVPDYGRITCDIAYGGAFYAILSASCFKLDYETASLEQLVRAGTALTDAIRQSRTITHLSEPDLGFLYGTIITDEATGTDETANICIFAISQIDRSPTGSGVTARMALDYVKGLVKAGESRVFRSITGGRFSGEVVGTGANGVTVRVSGRAYLAGEGTFVIEEDDPLGWGFDLARR
jgi:proline racemase